MIFAPDMVALIRARRKTQTRRPVKLQRPPLPEIPEKACRYKPGGVYKVQSGRGKKGILTITILDVRQEKLGEITPQDARREGFRFTSEFMTRWEELHGTVDPDQDVWVISFTVGDLRGHLDRPRLLTSLGHVGQVEYETVPGRPGGHGKHRWPAREDQQEDYTDRPDQAMGGNADPGEALTEQQLKPYVKAAHLRDQARRSRANLEKPRATRLAAIEQAAAAGEPEAKRALHVIDQRIQAAERKQSRDAA